MKVEIGNRLKRIRVGKGFTQKELASKIRGGIDYSYIGKIERGEQLPSLKILMKVSEALSVPVGYFFQDEKGAVVTELLSYDLGFLFKDEKGLNFIRELRFLSKDDLPLITEIIRVLNRHGRSAKYIYSEANEGEYLKAAEGEADYKGHESKGGSRKLKKKPSGP